MKTTTIDRPKDADRYFATVAKAVTTTKRYRIQGFVEGVWKTMGEDMFTKQDAKEVTKMFACELGCSEDKLRIKEVITVVTERVVENE